MNNNFQTPPYICKYMAGFLKEDAGKILEPTAGSGNLLKELKNKGEVFAPDDFFKMKKEKFDHIIMNPPFTPMKKGYDILYGCMEMSDSIICLMPWMTMINSKKRTDDIMRFGLRSITHLPRNVFPSSRVQTCILEMKNGYEDETIFLNPF